MRGFLNQCFGEFVEESLDGFCKKTKENFTETQGEISETIHPRVHGVIFDGSRGKFSKRNP